MKKQDLKRDILRLKSAITDYEKKNEEIIRLRERIKYGESLCIARAYAYHIMPVSCIDTVYSYYEEDLRECTEWMSDKRFGFEAWTDYWTEEDNIKALYRKNAVEMFGCNATDEFLTKDCHGEPCLGELPVAGYAKAILLCDKVFCVDSGWVLKLSDPYGCFVSQPMELDEKRAKSYVGKMLSVVLLTKYRETQEKEKFSEFLSTQVKSNNRMEPVYERNIPIFEMYEGVRYRQLEVMDVVDTPYAYKKKWGEEDRSLSPLLQFVKNMAGVSGKHDIKRAIDAIEEYVPLCTECACYKRFSDTEIRVILREHVLFSFMMCNDVLCFSKEKGHVEGDGAYEFCFREEVYDRYSKDYYLYDVEYSFRMLGVSPDKELKEWSVYAPEGDSKNLAFKSKKKLSAMKTQLIERSENLIERFKDRWGYTQLVAGLDLSNSPAIFNEDFNRNYTLCEHPEYETKWKNTFFDWMKGQIVYHLNTLPTEERVNGCQVIWHEYFLKNGAKSPFENIHLFNIEWVRRHAYYRLESDICVKYIGLCDSASCIDGVSTIHLVDPSGNAYFYGLDLAPEIIKEATGHICTITCVYNYFEEGKYRLKEFEVLPFLLREKIGAYPEEAIIDKRNLVIRGKF